MPAATGVSAAMPAATDVSAAIAAAADVSSPIAAAAVASSPIASPAVLFASAASATAFASSICFIPTTRVAITLAAAADSSSSNLRTFIAAPVAPTHVAVAAACAAGPLPRLVLPGHQQWPGLLRGRLRPMWWRRLRPGSRRGAAVLQGRRHQRERRLRD